MAAKRRKMNHNRAGKWCISLILLAFVGVMSIQTIKLHQKAEEYARRQAELELQLDRETARLNREGSRLRRELLRKVTVLFFMHTGTQWKYVSKADGCPARE